MSEKKVTIRIPLKLWKEYTAEMNRRKKEGEMPIPINQAALNGLRVELKRSKL